jgi:vesicle-fusing ATPase
VRTSDKIPLLSVLLEGPTQSGKTALAAMIAAESEFPFVRMLTRGYDSSGYSEGSKCNHVFKMFQDSWKSPLSMVIIARNNSELRTISRGSRARPPSMPSNRALWALQALP